MADVPYRADVRRFSTRVLSNTQLTSNIYDLRIEYPEGAFLPGQFVNLYLNRADWLLPRPISVADGGEGWIRLIYAVVGKGTEIFSRLNPGDALDVSTLIGNGFKPSTYGTVYAVGGGVGVPPVFAAAKKEAARGERVIAVVGFRAEPILLDDFGGAIGAENVYCAIEDASVIPVLEARYPKIRFALGNVVTILGQIIPAEADEKAFMAACGPTPMLKALQAYVKAFDPENDGRKRFELQLSLEERMGCGFGCCAGCVTQIRDPQTGTVRRVGVCSLGPVFAGETVVFYG